MNKGTQVRINRNYDKYHGCTGKIYKRRDNIVWVTFEYKALGRTWNRIETFHITHLTETK